MFRPKFNFFVQRVIFNLEPGNSSPNQKNSIIQACVEIKMATDKPLISKITSQCGKAISMDQSKNYSVCCELIVLIFRVLFVSTLLVSRWSETVCNLYKHPTHKSVQTYFVLTELINRCKWCEKIICDCKGMFRKKSKYF